MGDSGPSASPTSVIGNHYYVFLSFRGSDTRKGFVDHLYHKLVGVVRPFPKDIVFRDDDILRVGEPVGDNLFSAIDHSTVSIPVISEHYADSEWCLRELIRIMKCHQSRRQIVLPVLYKVKPAHVKFMNGPFGEAFTKKIEKGRYSHDFIKEATEALKKVVDLKVYESDESYSGHEGRLVEELVEVIRCRLQRDFPTYRPLDLVGFDDHVAKVMNLADTAFPEPRLIVIHGIGGIGKTTLVTTIYERLFPKFQWTSFLKDIRETIKSKDMQYVQSLLDSDLTKGREHAVRHSEIGIRNIRRSAAGKRVLMVLDDVDCQDHLNKLIGDCEFGSGSRIFITCRDKTLRTSGYQEHELQKMNRVEHELQKMNRVDSLILFNRYAFPFEKEKSSEELEELAVLSGEIVDTSGGLPLALVTVGSLLKDKDKSIWIETLAKLKKVPNEDVQKILRTSYDSLGYQEQQMFLDIACFFVGIDKRIATHLWDDLQFFPASGLKMLINSSLIIDNGDNELSMHDQLRDLGRAIARPADKKLWKCTRLWDKEAITVQLSKEENRYIEALSLDEKGSRKFMEQSSYKRMPHLKFLRLSKVNFVGNFKDSLSELRWLEWEMCPDFFMAANVHLEKLLVLDLSRGFISEEWRGWESIEMERLEVLNLSWCSDLTRTPNLSAFKNLETLILENCENLGILDPSIGDVKRLISLNLRYCGSLKELPKELGQLTGLEELVVDETDIQEIPDWIGSLVNLKTLSAVGCRLLTRVSSSVSALVSLSTLNLGTCKKLHELPDSFQALGKLQRLSLERCYMLGEIPSSIGELGELVELDLSSTGIKELPESIGGLNKLKILRISHSEIEKLHSAVGKLKSLQELDASGCHKLKGEILLHEGGLSDSERERLSSAVGKLKSLQDACDKLKGEILLHKGGLSSLITLRLGSAKISRLLESPDERPTLELHELSNLQHLDLLHCTELQLLPKPPPSLSFLQLTCLSPALPPLSHLSLLKELNLHSCMSLQSIPELPSCIQKLRVCKCPKLERLSIPPEWKSLLELELLQCYGLRKLKGLEALESLRKLDVSISTELSNLNDFEDLESLRYLDRQSYDDEKVDNLREIRGLEKLASLEVLNISERAHIKQLELSKSEHLEQLIVNNCHELSVILFHDEIKPLKRIEKKGCQKINTFPPGMLNPGGKEQQRND